MPRLRRWMVTFAGFVAATACTDTMSPKRSDILPGVSGTATDPTGDVFGTSNVRWDITALTIASDSADFVVTLDFSAPLISPTSRDSTAMVAFVEFDTDQNPATGVTSTVDEFRNDGGLTGLGVDYQLALSAYASDSSVSVYDSRGREVGRVKPKFESTRVTVRIPARLLGGDDGQMNAAAIVGSASRASDIVPNAGHVVVQPRVAYERQCPDWSRSNPFALGSC